MVDITKKPTELAEATQFSQKEQQRLAARELEKTRQQKLAQINKAKGQELPAKLELAKASPKKTEPSAIRPIKTLPPPTAPQPAPEEEQIQEIKQTSTPAADTEPSRPAPLPVQEPSAQDNEPEAIFQPKNMLKKLVASCACSTIFWWLIIIIIIIIMINKITS